VPVIPAGTLYPIFIMMTDKQRYKAILGICDKFIEFYSKQEFSKYENNWVVYDKRNKRALTFDEGGLFCLRFLVECPPAFSLNTATLFVEKGALCDDKGDIIVLSVISRLDYYQRLKEIIKVMLSNFENDDDDLY